MIENTVKHTVIVTVDKATVDLAKTFPLVINDVRKILDEYALTKQHATVIKGKGLYYKRTLEV
jgi:hypothetical protein